jgi:hypothetical protein
MLRDDLRQSEPDDCTLERFGDEIRISHPSSRRRDTQAPVRILGAVAEGVSGPPRILHSLVAVQQA